MNNYQTLTQIRGDLDRGFMSCEQLVNAYLDEINSKPQINAFLEVYKDEAIERARTIDEKLRTGNPGRLTGLVLGLKDNICFKGHKVSAASKILGNFESLYSATVVQRLLEEDAIIIGRLNCDEFAMGSSNENSGFGPVKNPIDEERVPGGSSGGSAAAVAAGFCHASLGTDTGGSIRQPASFCGTVGLKPTYGRVSRYGLIAYGSSFDQIGPLTKSIEDAALITEVIGGVDEYDSTLANEAMPALVANLENEGNEVELECSIGYLEDAMNAEGLDTEIRETIHNVLSELKNKGAHVNPEEFQYFNQVIPVYQILSNAEASSNFARYDGILYGYRSSEAESLKDTLVKSRTEGFGEEVKRRIMLGTFVLSEGYYEAYYSKAQKIRRLVKENLEAVFENNDFILAPVTPSTAFRIGRKADDPIAMYLEDLFTVPANLAGFPAISLPVGHHSNGMPFGIQVIGKPFDEQNLLSFSNRLMRAFISKAKN